MGSPADIAALKEQLVKAVDREELVKIACALVNIPSATGRTRTLSAYPHYGKAQSDWNPRQGEHASITDLVDSAKVYLTLVANVPSRTREQSGLGARQPHRH